MNHATIHMLAWIAAVSGGLHLLLLGLLRWGWQRGAESASPGQEPYLPPLSVLIAARNEAENLARFLPEVLRQSYPEFEVCVLLNQTNDHSEELLGGLQKVYPQLRWWQVAPIPPDWAPKKWALQQGVALARHEHLALIDADCKPEPDWLRGIGRRFGEGHEVILGLGGYCRRPSWLNALVRFETQYTALQYIGAATWGMPYMGVGRNLAYTRSFFQRHGGLAPWRDSLSGDDDLLIGAHARHAKTTVMTEAGTRTWSEAPHGWREWWAQKTRHVSASRHYTLTIKGLLGVFHSLPLLFYGATFIGLAIQATAWSFWGLYMGVAVAKTWMLYPPCRLDEERPLLNQFLGLDLSYFVYNLSVVPLGLIKRPAWKSRTPEYRKTPRKTGS